VLHSSAEQTAMAPAVSLAAPTAAAVGAAAVPTHTSAPDSGVFRADWAAILLKRLELFKRYPAEAAAGHEQGVVYLRFVIDREGLVHSARIDKSSGYDALDHEALTLARRAQPFPKPPSQLAGDSFDLVVPIRFSLDP
ncbi:MAG: energy transducer TonB, partial [Rhizomicrobium sp.]